MVSAKKTTTNFSPDISNDNETRAEFANEISPLSDRKLALVADCSTETVKCWRAGRSFPNGRHLMKLVAGIPRIEAWFSRRTGRLNNPQSFAEMCAFLEKAMASNTPEGRALRARREQIITEESRG